MEHTHQTLPSTAGIMEVQLYVYDLSRGMARSMSRAILGIQIDAIYHTSVVVNGLEILYGRGIQQAIPGTTHHGQPMETLSMGQTALPMDVIFEYLESLQEIYTAESYDLFMHNCNNFSHDFCMFLTGRGIPDHITGLPETVLHTPFGQMLKPQIDSAMRPLTQASIPLQTSSNGVAKPPDARSATSRSNGKRHAPAPAKPVGKVHIASNNQELNQLLASAASSCAVIFFTSATCPPCKLVYPTYNDLAAEAGDKATLIKVDISNAYDIASTYSISATPTFMTFLKGQQEDTWPGADPARLSGNVRMLIQNAFPPHPHQTLGLPIFLRTSLQPITYGKVPPLEKLLAKMGEAGKDPSVTAIVDFITTRNSAGAKEARLPDLSAFGSFLLRSLSSLPTELQFTAFDLFRVALVDPRVSGVFLQQQEETLKTIFKHVCELKACPYNLQLVSLHTALNLFTSPIITDKLTSQSGLAAELLTLVTDSLSDKDHSNIRVAAAALALNIATIEYKHRVDGETTGVELAQSTQVELAASLIEAISEENDSPEAARGMVVALARLAYRGPEDSEILDLCKAMNAAETVLAKCEVVTKAEKPLINEIATELLGKGLNQRR